MNKLTIRMCMVLSAAFALGACSNVPTQHTAEAGNVPILSAEQAGSMIVVMATHSAERQK